MKKLQPYQTTEKRIEFLKLMYDFSTGMDFLHGFSTTRGRDQEHHYIGAFKDDIYDLKEGTFKRMLLYRSMSSEEQNVFVPRVEDILLRAKNNKLIFSLNVFQETTSYHMNIGALCSVHNQQEDRVLKNHQDKAFLGFTFVYDDAQQYCDIYLLANTKTGKNIHTPWGDHIRIHTVQEWDGLSLK
jgi:hypothetical protein